MMEKRSVLFQKKIYDYGQDFSTYKDKDHLYGKQPVYATESGLANVLENWAKKLLAIMSL